MKKIKGLRWWIISLIALVTVINYIDRNALAIMWPSIASDLGLSKEDYALILTFFMVAYAISQSVSGKLYDRIGTRKGFILSIMVWSISSAFHGLATSLVSFAVLRLALGFGEAGVWPGAAKSNAEWHPTKERAFAQGMFNAGASLGAIVSAPLIVFFYSFLGWKLTFPIIATFSLLWIIPWWIINKNIPKQHPWITDEEKEYILSGQKSSVDSINPQDERKLSWKELLGYKQSYSVIVTRFFIDPIWFLFLSWLPLYLSEKFNFDVKQIGLFAWVPYVGAAIGSLFGGWVSGYLIGRGWALNKARKVTIIGGLLLCLPTLIITAYAQTPITAVILIAIILFGFQITINNVQTLPSDFFSGKSVGSLAGLGGTAGVGGVLITMWLVPYLTQTSWTPFFIMGAALVPVGIVSVLFFSGEIKKVKLKEK